MVEVIIRQILACLRSGKLCSIGNTSFSSSTLRASASSRSRSVSPCYASCTAEHTRSSSSHSWVCPPVAAHSPDLSQRSILTFHHVLAALSLHRCLHHHHRGTPRLQVLAHLLHLGHRAAAREMYPDTSIPHCREPECMYVLVDI